MNIIILIIASNDGKYMEMQEIWKRYWKKHPHIKCFFIKNDPNLSENILLLEDTIYYKCEESIRPGVLYKTVYGINYCLNHFEFDYIFRTNLSSMLDLYKMYDYITHNANFDYGALIGEDWHTKQLFGAGCGFFLSKNACQHLVKNAYLLKTEEMDDVAIGILLLPIFGIKPISRCDIENLDDESYTITDDSFHYRCKSDHEHHLTIEIMNKLFKKIYLTDDLIL